MRKKVFISGPLTGLERPGVVKANYERLAQLCECQGIEAYVPHRRTDPLANPDVPASEVYEIDRLHVSTADLVIAYVGIPSLGVGQEIEIARQNEVGVVLLCERGKQLSRMTTGSPNVIAEIRFDEFDEALEEVRALLVEGPHGANS